jgi:hypothetical protein
MPSPDAANFELVGDSRRNPSRPGELLLANAADPE